MVFVGGWVCNGMIKHVHVRFSVAQVGLKASTVILPTASLQTIGSIRHRKGNHHVEFIV